MIYFFLEIISPFNAPRKGPKINPIGPKINIGDNTILLKKILARYYAEHKIETSYYFYNFGYRPFMSDKVFMLN